MRLGGVCPVFHAVCVPFSMPTSSNPSLLVVRPEPQHLHSFLFLENLVDQPVLNVDSPRVRPGQITHQFLIWRWILIRIGLYDLE